MIDDEIQIETDDGVMNTFVTHPEEGGPFPVVFFYMDAPGKREELHDMARRIGTVGYYVVLPNLYYRQRVEWQHDFTSPASRREMFELMDALSNAMIVEDTRAMFDYVDTSPHADAGRVGCVGYCMSGPFSLAVAAGYPDRIHAAASVHGVRLFVDEPDSPHLGFATTPAELYVACAETDSYAPPEMVDAVEAELARSGCNGRLERYPGTEHGFVFPRRGDIFNKAGAERHWERLHSLFDRNLKQ